MTMTWCQVFLENLPKESWSERNDKHAKFKSMEDANTKRLIENNIKL